MTLRDIQLALAKDIQAITCCQLFKADGDQLIATAKLIYGREFDDAASSLLEYKKGIAELVRYLDSDENVHKNRVAAYHAELRVVYHMDFLYAYISTLWLSILNSDRLDRSKPPCGIWKQCSMQW